MHLKKNICRAVKVLILNLPWNFWRWWKHLLCIFRQNLSL